MRFAFNTIRVSNNLCNLCFHHRVAYESNSVWKLLFIKVHPCKIFKFRSIMEVERFKNYRLLWQFDNLLIFENRVFAHFSNLNPWDSCVLCVTIFKYKWINTEFVTFRHFYTIEELLDKRKKKLRVKFQRSPRETEEEEEEEEERETLGAANLEISRRKLRRYWLGRM